MPIIVGVKHLLSCEAGDRVTGVRAVIKVTFPQREFGSGDNAGTVQNGYLRDLDDPESEIMFKVWNRDDLSDLKGCVVEFVAVSGKQGATGLKLVDHAFKGKTELCLDVSEKATMDIADGEGEPPAEPDEEPPPKPKAKASAPAPKRAAAPAPKPAVRTSAPAPIRPAGSKPTWTDVGGQMKRVGAAYASALIEVVTRVAPAVFGKTGMAMTPDHMHSAAVTVLLGCIRDRDKLGLLPDLPWKGYLGNAEPAPTAVPQQPEQLTPAEAAAVAEAAVEPYEDDVPF